MKRIAIISTNKYKYSETFIHLHVEELPGEIHLLHGGYLPEFVSRGLHAPDHALCASFPQANIWQRLRRISPEAQKQQNLRQAILHYLQKQEIQIVLAEYGPSGVALMDICQQANIPLLVHFHGYDAGRADILAAQGQQYPEMFGKAAGMIAVSQHMRAQLQRLGAPANKLHLIPYGVDVAAFAARNQAEPPYLLALGRLTPKKSPMRSIQAFAAIAVQVPQVRLIFAGDGELLAECQALAAQIGLSDRIEFRGAVNHAAVPALLQGATALVQHSVTTENGDAEGLPLAILEAMATGIPVIATRHAGIPDAVTHGVEGLLSAEGDVAGMAAHMLQVLKAPQKARALGDAGKCRVAAHFSKGRYLSDLTRLIDRSIAAKTAQ